MDEGDVCFVEFGDYECAGINPAQIVTEIKVAAAFFLHPMFFGIFAEGGLA